MGQPFGECRNPNGRRIVVNWIEDDGVTYSITHHEYLLDTYGECVWCGREAWQKNDNQGYFQVPIQTPQNTDKEAQ
jgi:hypothetical protein